MQYKTWLVLGVAAVAMGLAGCEWTGSSDDDSVNSKYAWANFNGVYRGDNGAIVSDYTVSGGGGDVRVKDERVGTVESGRSTYRGTVSGHPVVENSFQVSAGKFSLSDIGGGTLSGGGKTGHISYDSGAWNIDLLGEYPPAGTEILASYTYTKGASSDAGGSSIYTLTVAQDGNSVTLTDNNGAAYSGKIKGVSPGTPTEGADVTANYSVSGTSAAGKSVKIVGAFTGSVSGNTTGTMWLQNRKINGSWVESGGASGNVSGFTPSSSVVNTSTNGV